MKGMEIFCASQASTAICMSMEAGSSSSSVQLGGKAIDRYNPIIRDGRRSSIIINPPCSSQPPINPKPYHLLQKTRAQKETNSASKSRTEQNSKKKKSLSKATENDSLKSSDVVARKSIGKAKEFITPPGSTRYLLSDTGISDMSLVPIDINNSNKTQIAVLPDESTAPKPQLSSSPLDQVVVLRVSLHCKGCEGKVKKHLSRMQGVRSFKIDFKAKMVTVVGDVTPVSVLASLSKVKAAQIWTSSMPPPSSVASDATKKESFKK